MSAVFHVAGRAVLAELLSQHTLFLGVGIGDPAWDAAPAAQSPLDHQLVAPLGLTRQRGWQFVTPDPAGDVVAEGGTRFAPSDTPTRYLSFTFKLDVTDAVGTTPREYGLFFGSSIAAGIPAGQTWIPHTDVAAYGRLIMSRRFNSIIRDGSIEQSFKPILTL